MGFFKKFFLGSVALSFILLGGSGTQSSNILFQGGGFIGLIIGLVALYLFAKMAWKAMGCLPSLIVIVGIICFVIYAIGGFNDGLGGVVKNLKVFVNGHGTMTTPQIMTNKEKTSTLKIHESFLDMPGEEETIEQEDSEPQSKSEPQTEAQEQTEQPQGGLMGFWNSLTKATQQESGPKDINDLPSFISPVTVLTADTLDVQGYKIKLYGVAAPDIRQMCADRNGSSYNCGQQAALWLSSWLTTNPVTCHVMKEYENGNMVAACSLGQYDLGAAIINAGWAVAEPKTGEIYAPYEENARQKRDGLWQGNFYMPWDWKAMQNRKPQYKIIQKGPTNRKSFFKF